jgi:hypothetical protein
MFHESFDGSSLAGRVASFKKNHQALARCFHPCLQFQQFHLEIVFFPFVAPSCHQVFVGIPTLPPIYRQFGIRAFSSRSFGCVFVFNEKVFQRDDIVRGCSGDNGIKCLHEACGAFFDGSPENILDGYRFGFTGGRDGFRYGVLLDTRCGECGGNISFNGLAGAGFPGGCFS